MKIETRPIQLSTQDSGLRTKLRLVSASSHAGFKPLSYFPQTSPFGFAFKIVTSLASFVEMLAASARAISVIDHRSLG
jgi:hypothetical protein